LQSKVTVTGRPGVDSRKPHLAANLISSSVNSLNKGIFNDENNSSYLIFVNSHVKNSQNVICRISFSDFQNLPFYYVFLGRWLEKSQSMVKWVPHTFLGN